MKDPYAARLTASTEPQRPSLAVLPLLNRQPVFFSCVFQNTLLELDRSGTRQLLEKLDAFGTDVSETCAALRENLRTALAD